MLDRERGREKKSTAQTRSILYWLEPNPLIRSNSWLEKRVAEWETAKVRSYRNWLYRVTRFVGAYFMETNNNNERQAKIH